MRWITRRKTIAVPVGNCVIGGDAPISVQSMTNTSTADATPTTRQIVELAAAGSELVRITVNTSEAAKAVPEIVRQVRDAGCPAPIIGDFHYNGHRLLTEFPDCARRLDKYRINPGNVGSGNMRDTHFAEICRIAVDNNKPVRIGVNVGSLNSELVDAKMQENSSRSLGFSAEAVYGQCMVISALQSIDLALQCGLRSDQIVVSCKSSSPRQLIEVHRELAGRTEQPIHLGLTEAGMGIKGLVWSSVATGILLSEGIGDTIRVSLTPRPDGDRRDEVYAACEILQSIGLRSFAPSITACPGCGRTTSTVFQLLAEETQAYVRSRLPEWKQIYPGVEDMRLAVMGCIVNGPGESRSANIGISLPGTGEEPRCPVYIDGIRTTTLTGSPAEISEAFQQIVEEYVRTKYRGSSKRSE